MAGLLIVLVFVNVGITGWLVSSHLSLRHTVRHLGNVQSDLVNSAFSANVPFSEDDSEV